MKFDFKLSDNGKQLFSEAEKNQQDEASAYLLSLGVTEKTIVEHRGRRYTSLRVCKKSVLDRWFSLVGIRISKNGTLGNTEHIWDAFNVIETDA